MKFRRRWGATIVALLVHLTAQGLAQAQAAAPKPAASATASPARESIWIQQEQARFGDWLARRPADVLVVPLQISGRGFDPVERLLMAVTIADHLSTAGIGSVADPVMVGRALGEGSRTYDDAAIQALADRMEARLILIGSAGHDGASKFEVNLRVLRKDATGKAWRDIGIRRWQALALNEMNPPYRTIEPMLPDLDALVGAKPRSVTRQASKVSLDAPGVLPPLNDLVRGTGKSSDNLHVAQLVASLYPRFPEAPHERAWLQTLRLAKLQRAGDRSLIMARALMHLGRRPAALATLGEPQTNEQRALHEVLNGNLPAAERHARSISDPVLRLIAQIELRDLRLPYQAANETIEKADLGKLVSAKSDWYPFLRLRVSGEGSVWGVESPVEALFRFETLFYGSTQALQGQMEAWSQIEDGAAVEIESARLSLQRHATLLQADRDMDGGASLSMRRLLLDLYQAQIVTDLMGEVYVTLDTRRLIDKAHELLASQDPILRGHGDFETAKARLAWYEYARHRGQQRSRWQELALAHSRNAFQWSNRASRALDFTDPHMASTPQIAAVLDPLRVEFFWDWPVSPRWIPAALREDKRAMQRFADGVVANEISGYSMISWLAARPVLADRSNALLQGAQGRFDGSPDLADDRAGALLRRFDVKGAEQVYRNYVASRPMAVTPYYWYAWLLIGQGKHREAYDMYEAYPGFAEDSGENRVSLSSSAKSVGEMFWLAGRFEYGRPLLQRSAAYETGSAASLSSAAFLALDDGEFDHAAKIYMQEARRYSDLNGLDEYFKLIFALGRPEEAWRIYKEVHKDGNGGKVMGSIARGVRVLGWTDSQVMEWLRAPKNAALADRTFFYAPRAALAASIIDRALPADLAGVVQQFNLPSPYMIDRAAQTVVERADPATMQRRPPTVCGPSAYGGGPAKGLAGTSAVDSHLVYFAKGYQALDRGDHAAAFRILDDAARTFEFFGHGCENVSYMLPYLALAAGKVKDTAALQKYLDNTSFNDRTTHYNLAMAVLAALNSQHKQADAHLETALNRWSWGRYQALPADYIYADIVERLYRLTDTQAYRDRLVRWAKIRQRIAPAESWAYAKEYLYTNNGVDKQRALGMLQYLDPLSNTLKNAKAQELSAARSAFDPGNPFLEWRRRQAAKKAQ